MYTYSKYLCRYFYATHKQTYGHMKISVVVNETPISSLIAAIWFHLTHSFTHTFFCAVDFRVFQWLPQHFSHLPFHASIYSFNFSIHNLCRLICQLLAIILIVICKLQFNSCWLLRDWIFCVLRHVQKQIHTERKKRDCIHVLSINNMKKTLYKQSCIDCALSCGFDDDSLNLMQLTSFWFEKISISLLNVASSKNFRKSARFSRPYIKHRKPTFLVACSSV